MKKAEELIEKMLDWKFFRNNWYSLSQEDREIFKKDLAEKLEEYEKI